MDKYTAARVYADMTYDSHHKRVTDCASEFLAKHSYGNELKALALFYFNDLEESRVETWTGDEIFATYVSAITPISDVDKIDSDKYRKSMIHLGDTVKWAYAAILFARLMHDPLPSDKSSTEAIKDYTDFLQHVREFLLSCEFNKETAFFAEIMFKQSAAYEALLQRMALVYGNATLAD